MKCFEYNKMYKKSCTNKTCRYWIQHNNTQNCCINAAKQSEKFTLQDIGEIFNVTRMRICQIEKGILGKLRSSLPE